MESISERRKTFISTKWMKADNEDSHFICYVPFAKFYLRILNESGLHYVPTVATRRKCRCTRDRRQQFERNIIAHATLALHIKIYMYQYVYDRFVPLLLPRPVCWQTLKFWNLKLTNCMRRPNNGKKQIVIIDCFHCSSAVRKKKLITAKSCDRARERENEM